MECRRMFELAQALAIAKSRQDIGAAMKLFHPDMLLETPAFGTTAKGLAANEAALRRFFRSFPDYEVALQGHADNGEALICWSTVRMTMTGDRFGVTPNGLRAELPVFIHFAFKDGLIAGERFVFDLSALCAQSGVSTDAVRQKLFGQAAPVAEHDRRSFLKQKDAPMSSEPKRDPRIKAVADIRTEPLFDIVVDLAPRLNIGDGPLGRRILFGSAGGSFLGEKLRGDVLPGGGDWALFRADGAMMLDVRLTLRTHDDALVHMSYGGRWTTPAELRAEMADPVGRYQVDPARYYFRTNPLFETGAKQYAWLNDIVCIGCGYLIEGGIAYKVSRVV